MIKFIYTTDWHLKSIPSSSVKIDEFSSKLIQRADQILSQKVDFILHGGDLFDSPDISDVNFFNDVVKLFYDHKIPICILPGQHDLIGYEPNSLKWSALKTLENAGLITILQPGINDVYGLNIYAIYPHPPKNHTLDLYSNLKNCIIVSHNIISPIKQPFNYLLTDEINKVIDQCLVLSGDLHMSFVKTYESNAFLNPGPLMRNSAVEYNETGFFYIVFDKENFSCKYKKINFPDSDVIVENISSIDEFTNKIVIEQKYLNLEEIVIDVCRKMYNDKDIEMEALKWIRMKE